MSRIITILLLTAAVPSLHACSGSSDSSSGPVVVGGTPTPSPTPTPSTTGQIVAQLERDGKLPVLDRSASVAGPDTNTNGIRDDIDTYIAAQNYTATQKPAVEMIARATQRALLVDVTDKTAVAAVNLESARAVNCAFLRFGSGSAAAGRAAQNIEKITTNTKARLLAYLAFAKGSDGSVIPSPEGDSCA